MRWDGVGSLARGLQMIREQADRTPQGQWVRVMGGWSPYQFTERRMPTVAELNKVAPQVAPAGFATAQALLSFLDSDLRPARTRVTERLSHPALTGLTQHELHELTRRLAARQSAHAERLAYQRRGSPRQPGAQAGVFPQKISNSERVLLTILYHRGLCTLDVLASALSDVSRTAVGNGIRETLPLLQQEDHLPGQAPTRYRTAADLLAAGVPSGTPTS